MLLYLDEIQYFNKKQQQTLLEYIENGKITLIASTTENPYFYVYNAILSRSTVFEFKPVEKDEAQRAVSRALNYLEARDSVTILPEPGVKEHIAQSCGGDIRKALNAVEFLYTATRPENGVVRLTMADAKQVSQRSAMRYDKSGDDHYDDLSALMKSIRGSDPDAAVHYLARFFRGRRSAVCLPPHSMLRGGGYRPCLSAGHPHRQGLRRQRFAAGPAGGASAAGRRGSSPCHGPEVNSGCMAIDAAIADVKAGRTGPVPRELQNVHADGTGFERDQGYLYPHNFPNHWVRQQYLPRRDQRPHLLHLRRQQNRTGRQALLGRDQEVTHRSRLSWRRSRLRGCGKQPNN